MANATRERKLKETALTITGTDGHLHLIDDPLLVKAYYITDMDADTVIELQSDRHKTDLKLKAAEERATSREQQILTLCGVVGVEAEESLEQTIRNMAACEKRLMITESLRALVVNRLSGFKPEELEALRRFLRGERPSSSTGIHGGPTMGYGDLDANGYFQYPMVQTVVKQYERALKFLQNSDTLEDTLRTALRWMQNDVAMNSPERTGYAERVKQVQDVLDRVTRNKP